MGTRFYRRLFIVIAFSAVAYFSSYLSLNIFLGAKEPYPMLRLPGFAHSSAYTTRVHQSQFYVIQIGKQKDSVELKKLFSDIPGHFWPYVIDHNFKGRNKATYRWFKSKTHFDSLKSVYYVKDSCAAQQNQVECYKNDTIHLFR